MKFQNLLFFIAPKTVKQRYASRNSRLPPSLVEWVREVLGRLILIQIKFLDCLIYFTSARHPRGSCAEILRYNLLRHPRAERRISERSDGRKRLLRSRMTPKGVERND